MPTLTWLDHELAAKAIFPYFAGRVKRFAIDPPYNTRSAFEHYGDISMPKPFKKNMAARFVQICLVVGHQIQYIIFNTRAVPLVRKDDAHQGRVLFFGKRAFYRSSAMTTPYIKPWLSIPDQLLKLKKAGLVIVDEVSASQFLRHINYYRFSGYGLVIEQTRHVFMAGATFEHIRNAYEFDRSLRDLVTESLEVIELDLPTGWQKHPLWI